MLKFPIGWDQPIRGIRKTVLIAQSSTKMRERACLLAIFFLLVNSRVGLLLKLLKSTFGHLGLDELKVRIEGKGEAEGLGRFLVVSQTSMDHPRMKPQPGVLGSES